MLKMEILVIGILNFPSKSIKKSIDKMLDPKEIKNLSKKEKEEFFPNVANSKKYPGINRTMAIDI